MTRCWQLGYEELGRTSAAFGAIYGKESFMPLRGATVNENVRFCQRPEARVKTI
jgi:hypothetical protein